MLLVKGLFLKVLIVSLIFVTVVNADMIELKNGTKMPGQITGISAGQYQIVTDFGILNIGLEKIRSITTDGYVYVALKSGSTLLGKLTYKNQRTQLQTNTGIVDISDDEPVALWLEGQANPLIPVAEDRRWKYEATLDVSGKTGNSEKISTAGSFAATLDTDRDRLQFYIRGERTKNNDEKSVEEILGGVDYENRFRLPHSWYARVELERDLIESIDLRATAAVGYGYYFINEDWHELRGRVGLQLRHEAFDEGAIEDEEARLMEQGDPDPDVDDNDTTLAADLGLFHRYDFGDWGRLITDLSYYPSLEDSANYRMLHITSLEVPLANSKFWKVRVGVENEYNSQPPGDIERLDTTYFTRLVLNWE